MAWRDLVTDSNGCGQNGNSLTNFVNSYNNIQRVQLENPSFRAAELPLVDELEHDIDEDAFNFSNLPTPDLALQDFLRRDQFDPLEGPFEDFASEYQQFRPYDDVESFLPQPAPPVLTSRRDMQLGDLFRQFFRSSMTDEAMGVLDLSDMKLSPLDKEKIKNRAQNLARHLTRDPMSKTFHVDQQLSALFDSLDIKPSFDPGFESAWQQTQRERLRNEDWATEFGQFNPPRDDFSDLEHFYQEPNEFQDLETIYSQVTKSTPTENSRNSQTEEWVSEYGQKELDDRYEEELWFSQFLPNGAKSIGNQTTNKWFNNSKMLPSNNTLSSWVSEYDNTAELRKLTGKFSEIDDPKIKNSRFMDFIQKIHHGELQFVDNKLVDETNKPVASNPPRTNNDEWVQQYNKSE